ncbi:MAG: hypothetical protein Q9159_005906 [Coniocarpon cinnabarinum]
MTNHSKKRKRGDQSSGDILTHDQIWDDTALLDSWNEAVEEYEGEDVEAVLDEAEADEEVEEGLEEGEANEAHEPDEIRDIHFTNKGTFNPTAKEERDSKYYRASERHTEPPPHLDHLDYADDDTISRIEEALELPHHPYHAWAKMQTASGLTGEADRSDLKFKDHILRWKTVEEEIRELEDDDEAKDHFLRRITQGRITAADLKARNGRGHQGQSGGIPMPTPADVMSKGPLPATDSLKSLMMSWYWAGYYGGLYEGQRQAAAGTSAASVPR